MTPPRTYAEWLPLLDKFRAGNDTVLDLLKAGKIEWTNVVAERWTLQVSGTLTTRLQTLSKQMQLSLDRARGDHFAISNSLLMTRRALSPLRSFVSMPSIPAEVQSHLESELNRWTTELQTSLERHAEGVRNDQGRLLKTIRDQPLTSGTVPEPLVPTTVNPAIRTRRVIL